MKHLNHKWKLNFKTSIFLSCMFLILFVVIILFWIPSRRYANLYRVQAQNYNQNIIQQTNIGISQDLLRFEEKIKAIIDDPQIRNFLNSSHNPDEFQYEYQNIIENFFDIDSLDAYYLECLDIYPINRSGHLQYGYKTTDISNIKRSKYYQNALIYPTVLNWLPYNNQEECLEVSRCIYDYDTYAIQGILVLRLSHEFLLDKFEALNILDADGIFIINSQKQILSSTDLKAAGKNYTDIDNFTELTGTYSKEGKIYSYAYIRSGVPIVPYDNWITIISLDEQSLYSSFREILYIFNVLAIVILLAAFITIVILSKYLTAPIYELVNAMKEVSKENLTVYLPEDTVLKEYVVINHGFNNMLKKLDTLINTVYKSSLAEKEAQLKTLQAQMNPHFLFNTLQMISWKAYEYEAYPVCDMITSLSYMLQTDLHSTNGKNNFTLRQEIEYIQQYSFIIKNKYDNKISISIDVPDELLDCKIPKLIIQPFIENSICHGLEPKTTPGYVSLKINKDSNDLLCIIEDNGNGMPPEILREVQQPNLTLSPEAAQNQSGHGIALTNIQRRIKILYGDKYGFKITSQVFKGTKVSLRIPYCPISSE